MSLIGERFPGDYWQVMSLPAVNVQATVTRAAPGVGKYNVCTGLDIILIAGTTAPAAIVMEVNLIDGVSGGTTYLWRGRFVLPATVGEMTGITRANLLIPGSLNTAMTLEFNAACGLNTYESVWLAGLTGSS